MERVLALWRRRELVTTLAAKDFKGRYRRLGLGVVWAVANPLIQAGLIALIFGLLVRRFPGAFPFPYPAYILTGNMPWHFFTATLTSGTGSILDSASIVQRVALPRTALPTANLLTNLYNLAFMLGTLLVLVAIMALDRMTQIWMLPLPVLLGALLVYGMTLLTATLQVRYRDIAQLISAATLAWFWATPIIYPVSIVREKSELLYELIRANPMTGVLSLYRAAFVHLPVDWVAVWWSMGWTVLFLVVGWNVFRAREGTVADFI